MPQYKSVIAVAILSMTASLAVAQGAAPQVASAEKTVALSQGSCVQVAAGDFVTFLWNPAFNPSTTAGIDTMTLTFAKQGETLLKAAVPHGGFLLRAVAGKHRDGIEEPIVDAHNGYYQMTFRPDLKRVQRGTYVLMKSQVTVGGDSGTASDSPVMTNEPEHAYFCLEVTSNPSGK